MPEIKRRTIAQRKSLKVSAADKAERSKRDKVKVRLQKLAVAHVLGNEPTPVENRNTETERKTDDMFYLEPTNCASNNFYESLNSPPQESVVDFKSQSQKIDPFTIEFKSLPTDVQHELLIEHIEETKNRAKTISYNQTTSSDDFSNRQIENVVAKNKLNCRLSQLRKLLKENNNTSRVDDHSVQVMRSDHNSEIVFTKQMNNSEFHIVDTRIEHYEDNKESISLIKSTTIHDDLTPSKGSEDLKNLMFGSDSDSVKSEESDSEVPERQVKNVFGLSRGHPGTFINPYSSHSSNGEFELSEDKKEIFILTKDSKSKPAFHEICEEPSSLKSDEKEIVDLPKNETSKTSFDENYEVTSSSESDFEEVEEEKGLISKVLSAKINISKPSVSSPAPLEENCVYQPPVPAPASLEDSFEVHSKKSPIIEVHADGVQHLADKNNSENIKIMSANANHFDLTEIHEQNKIDNNDLSEFPLLCNMINEGNLREDNLKSLSSDLDSELQSLQETQRKALSVSDVVNSGITRDVQELLTLFGVPYITAPGEAEAQCAELCNLSLCDGVITDDSDVFLFGEVSVYKDVFKKNKDTLCVTSRGVSRSLGLSRAALVDMAQLLGSDYCSGVRGIGPVMAHEIISKHESLKMFLSQTVIDKKYKKFDFSNIPDTKAVEAYLQPSVNSSTDPFKWDAPNVALLKDFLLKKVGWNSKKVDESLSPVLNNRSNKQHLITKYLSDEPTKQLNKKTKRVDKSVNNKSQNKRPRYSEDSDWE